MARGCGTYLSKGCAWPQHLKSRFQPYLWAFMQRKKQRKKLSCFCFSRFFISSFSWDLRFLDTPKISPFLLCHNERISPNQDAAEADAQRKNAFSTALMSMEDKDFGGILALFFQTLQCGFGFSEPHPWHCSLKFLPPIQSAVNCLYQRRVILVFSPVSDLPVSH